MLTAIERAVEIGAQVAQVFVKNNNQWVGRAFREGEPEAFRSDWKGSEVGQIVAHASYLINLASPDSQLWEKSIAAAADELQRCSELGIAHLVLHPGSHMGTGPSAGVERIAAALDCLSEKGSMRTVSIALETTAGQGTQVGWRFEELRDILASCARPEQVSVCMDTCHIFAAGYELREPHSYETTIVSFDKTVGLKKLAALHLNDSKRELGSRVDRHDHIGKGEIGLAGFRNLVNDPRLRHIPMILETPKGKDMEEDRVNLATLRRLVEKA
jgi:deoxyribonuclease-4